MATAGAVATSPVEARGGVGGSERWYAKEGDAVIVAMGGDGRQGLQRRRGETQAGDLRCQPDHQRETTVHVGGRAGAAARPHEPHAGRSGRRQPAHRPGLDGHRRGRPCGPQRGPRRAPGAQGPRECRRPRQDAGAADQGRARRSAAAGPRRRHRPGRLGPGRGGRHRRSRRANPALSNPGDAGGGAHRGERPHTQGCRRAARPGRHPR